MSRRLQGSGNSGGKESKVKDREGGDIEEAAP